MVPTSTYKNGLNFAISLLKTPTTANLGFGSQNILAPGGRNEKRRPLLKSNHPHLHKRTGLIFAI